MAKLIDGKEYEVNDVLEGSQCSCGKDVEFEVFGDHDSLHWAYECTCGLTVRLSQSTIIECSIENEHSVIG